MTNKSTASDIRSLTIQVCYGLTFVLGLLFLSWYPPAAWGVFCLLSVSYYAIVLNDKTICFWDRRLCVAVISAYVFPLMTLLLWGWIRPDDLSLFEDPKAYYHESCLIASAWRDGFFPILELKGSGPYLGTLHTGYHRVLATMFYLFGSNPIWGIVLNLLALPVIVTGIWIITRELAACLTDDRKRIASIAGFAAFAIALFPATSYWGRALLKDVTLSALYIGLIGGLLYFLRCPSILGGVFLCIASYFAAKYRLYAFAGIILGVGCFIAAKWMSWRAMILSGICLFMMGLVMIYDTNANRLLMQIVQSMYQIMPPYQQNDWTIGLKWLGSAIPRFFLSPYSWIWSSKTVNPAYGTFPGMWYLYLLIYPLVVCGICESFRRNAKLWLVVLIPILLNCLIFAFAFGGDVSRQRYYLECLLIPMAACGLLSERAMQRKVFVIVYGLIFLFASIQSYLYFSK